MDEAKLLLQKLQTADAVQQQEKILGQMTKLIIEMNEDDDESDSNAVQDLVMQSPAIDVIVSHLKGNEKDEGGIAILIASAKLIAEIAKHESVREPLVQKEIMVHLLTHLHNPSVTLATQACRAIGNICFDNDEGRLAVDEADGIATIMKVVTSQLQNSEEGSDQLRHILCGCLLNLTTNNEVLQAKAIDAKVLDLLNEVILTHIQDQDLTNMALLTIGSIIDADSGKASVSGTGLLSTFKTLLDRKDSNLTSIILELLNGIMESEPAKDQAAEIGLCDSLVNVVVSHGQDESETVKMASDVLVSILVGDASMERVYEDGKGPVFVECLGWLESDQDNLKTLGSLAIGNFARRDSYCVDFVNMGIVKKLLPLLKSGPDASFYLQHAVLSTLRNLAIPVSNKPRLLEQGVMEACLCLINSEVMAVIFKLLGVLRMLIEGQESAAIKLGQERGFLDCLSEWCTVEVHAGVKGEAPRVIASLIKNSKSSNVIQNLIRASCVGHLVAMAQSEHLVMQNESVMALTFICSTALGDAAVSLKEADLAGVVSKLLKDDGMPPEMLINVLSLTRAVMSAVSTSLSPTCALLACTNLMPNVRKNLQEEIINCGVIELVRALSDSHADTRVKDAAKETLPLLEAALESS